MILIRIVLQSVICFELGYVWWDRGGVMLYTGLGLAVLGVWLIYDDAAG